MPELHTLPAELIEGPTVTEILRCEMHEVALEASLERMLGHIKERGMFGNFGRKSVSSRRRIGIQTPKQRRQMPLMWH